MTIYPFSFTDNLVHINGSADNHIFIQGLIHLVIAYIYKYNPLYYSMTLLLIFFLCRGNVCYFGFRRVNQLKFNLYIGPPIPNLYATYHQSIRPQRFQWWVHMCSVLAQKENSSSNRFCKYHSALDCCVLILHCYKFKNSQQLVIKSCLQRTVPSKSHSTADSVSARPLFIIISFPLQV